MEPANATLKPVLWIGSAKVDLSNFPEDVKDAMGFALYVAQQGGKHADAKPLRGFGGAGVLEIVENHSGDTIVPSIRCGWLAESTYSTLFKRNRSTESKRQRPRST